MNAAQRAELERSAAQEARAGGNRIRRINQPEASTWNDCDRANADPIELRHMIGQARDRQYRAERDMRDDQRSPYRPDDRPWPILTIARHSRIAGHDCRTAGCLERVR